MAFRTSKFTLGSIGRTRTGATTMQGNLVGGVRVIGAREAIAKINRVGQIAYRDLGLITYRVATATKKKSQEVASEMGVEDTGNLIASHFVQKTAPYTYNVKVETTGGPVSTFGRNQADYAGYQHNGYHDRGGNWHPGRPFLATAAREMMPVVNAELSRLAAKISAL